MCVLKVNMKFSYILILGAVAVNLTQCKRKTLFNNSGRLSAVGFMPSFDGIGGGGGGRGDGGVDFSTTENPMKPLNTSSSEILLKKVPNVEDHFEIRLTKTIVLESNDSKTSIQDNKEDSSKSDITTETLRVTEDNANSSVGSSFKNEMAPITMTPLEANVTSIKSFPDSEKPVPKNAPTSENEKPNTNGTKIVATDKDVKDKGEDKKPKGPIDIDDRINFDSPSHPDQVARR